VGAPVAEALIPSEVQAGTASQITAPEVISGAGAPAPPEPSPATPGIFQRLRDALTRTPERRSASDEQTATSPETPTATPGPLQRLQSLLPSRQAVVDYAHDVVTGKVAARNMPQNFYDPKRTFAENARYPRALEQAIDVAMGVGPGAIKAFHSSLHDFAKFDINKLGTGEGAQAYGTDSILQRVKQ
jgi:hypothetical protein